jgi:hypothetical protein
MTDPVQMLIAAGAIPASPFGPSSRYANVAIAQYQVSASEPLVAYVLRRFVPQMRDIPVATRRSVSAGDRIDAFAAHYLGDVELVWRIADANAATDYLELTAIPGRGIVIPLPPGAAGV